MFGVPIQAPQCGHVSGSFIYFTSILSPIVEPSGSTNIALLREEDFSTVALNLSSSFLERIKTRYRMSGEYLVFICFTLLSVGCAALSSGVVAHLLRHVATYCTSLSRELPLGSGAKNRSLSIPMCSTHPSSYSTHRRLTEYINIATYYYTTYKYHDALLHT